MNNKGSRGKEAFRAKIFVLLLCFLADFVLIALLLFNGGEMESHRNNVSFINV